MADAPHTETTAHYRAPVNAEGTGYGKPECVAASDLPIVARLRDAATALRDECELPALAGELEALADVSAKLTTLALRCAARLVERQAHDYRNEEEWDAADELSAVTDLLRHLARMEGA